MLTVAAFYQFARLTDPQAVRLSLLAVAEAGALTGTILLAPEGINGTVAGPHAGIADLRSAVTALPGCATPEWKESHAARQPFARLKVRVKPEIVTMGQPGTDPARVVGRHVAAADWNALISAPDVAVIDTRNDYEVALGTFRGAIDPGTARFRDFPAWWAAHADSLAGKRIAMFCTGGIRCEKATSFLVAQGVAEVFHLQGGILKYLEDVPHTDSAWQGECFVFDERVSVGHGLVPGDNMLCRGCRRPLTPADVDSPEFERGVACPACRGEHSDADRARFRMRQRQSDLAVARGQRHVGSGER